MVNASGGAVARDEAGKKAGSEKGHERMHDKAHDRVHDRSHDNAQEKVHEKVVEKRRALGRGLESLLPGPRMVGTGAGVKTIPGSEAVGASLASAHGTGVPVTLASASDAAVVRVSGVDDAAGVLADDGMHAADSSSAPLTATPTATPTATQAHAVAPSSPSPSPSSSAAKDAAQVELGRGTGSFSESDAAENIAAENITSEDIAAEIIAAEIGAAEIGAARNRAAGIESGPAAWHDGGPGAVRKAGVSISAAAESGGKTAGGWGTPTSKAGKTWAAGAEAAEARVTGTQTSSSTAAPSSAPASSSAPTSSSPASSSSPAAGTEDEVILLELTLIDRNRWQTRRNFDEDAIAELADSIRAQGLIQPVVVRPKEEGGDSR